MNAPIDPTSLEVPESTPAHAELNGAGASPRRADAATVRIECRHATRLNLADFQNAVPLIRELVLVNDSDEELRDLELTLFSVPAFLQSRSWRIDRLNAGQTLSLSDKRCDLDGTVFARLNEAERATATLRLPLPTGPDAEPAVVIQTAIEIELLARDQWGGLATMPEMLAAFVQPNESYVEHLLLQSANVLEQHGQSRALNGYEQGPRHAWALASALWTAVVREGLTYSLPPASFEMHGQKIRGPARIAESRLATCLDLTLLFASALEQMGLNPLLLLSKGHAFVGVWLRKEEFSSAVIDDPASLRKRIKLKELLVFETTLVTNRPVVGFPYAIDQGARWLSEAQEDSFELCIDVRRSRMQRIKPLSGMTGMPGTSGPGSTGHGGIDGGGGAQVDPVFTPPDENSLPVVDHPDKVSENETPTDRLNPLAAQAARSLAAQHAAKLQEPKGDHLRSAGPGPARGSAGGRRQIHDERSQEDSRRQHAIEALSRKEVFVTVDVNTMEATLLDLYRTSRSSLQEGGSNTLYLAFGFLVWTEEKRTGKRATGQTDKPAEKRYRAPLLLLPVTLDRRSVRSGLERKSFCTVRVLRANRFRRVARGEADHSELAAEGAHD